MEGDWDLTVTGTIIRIDYIDVDKTGKHRRFFYEFSVRPESLGGLIEGAQLPDVLKVRIKDLELPQLTQDNLDVGDCVAMTVRAHGLKPTLFYLRAVSKLGKRPRIT